VRTSMPSKAVRNFVLEKEVFAASMASKLHSAQLCNRSCSNKTHTAKLSVHSKAHDAERVGRVQQRADVFGHQALLRP
jgi:hypothetical protein